MSFLIRSSFFLHDSPYDTRPDSYSIMASSSTLSAQELEILSSKAIAAKASAYCKSVRFSQNKDGMNVISAKMENYCAKFLHIIDICIEIYISTFSIVTKHKQALTPNSASEHVSSPTPVNSSKAPTLKMPHSLSEHVRRELLLAPL